MKPLIYFSLFPQVLGVVFHLTVFRRQHYLPTFDGYNLSPFLIKKKSTPREVANVGNRLVLFIPFKKSLFLILKTCHGEQFGER